jgi:peptidoglycan/LPS O-acetylase OafA/YrhL
MSAEPHAERRPDVDWLRAGAVYLLLAYHSAKVFDSTPFYHLKNDRQVDALNAFTGAVHQCHMPLLFVLAGWSMAHSLERRGRRGVLGERRERLLVPLAFGCLTIAPVIGYVQHRHGPGGDESFLKFLPSFYTQLEHFSWSHLWFLAYLIVFSVLYLPLFEALRRRRPIERVPARALYLAIVPFAAVQVTLRGRWPGYQNLYDDWANFSYYSLFFIAGFLLVRHPAVERAVHSERRRCALVGAAALLGMLALTRDGLPEAEVSVQWIAFGALSATAGVCLVAALLGYGARHLRREGPALEYARDSAMPVYFLHQPAVVLVAAAVVPTSLPVAVKLAAVLGGGTVATLAAYGLVVRRSRVLRRLLGTKGEPPPRKGTLRRRLRVGRAPARPPHAGA